MKGILIAVLVVSVSYFMMKPSKPNLAETKILDEYDYIVVGAGSSGGVVASRLAEDRSKKVLLLEAGPQDDDSSIHMPAAVSKLQKTDLDWKYATEPQENALLGFHGKKSFWPRGKVLGGTSGLNYMMYVRGHPKDFDSWAEEGCDGWSYKDMLPFFKKMENNEVFGHTNSPYHAVGGPVTVTTTPEHEASPLSDAILKAYTEVGIPLNHDFNGEHNFGAGDIQFNIKKGVRQSTAVAYIWPTLEKYDNFHVLTEAHVTKILLEGKKAVGVKFLKKSTGNTEHTVKARREVIISGGAINTPQILMLSGIGPRDHLEKLGIPVVADLPVGKNLQDHIILGVGFEALKNCTITLERASSITSLLKYFTMGSGLLSFPGVGTTAFVKFDEKSPVPEAQLLALLGFGNNELGKLQNRLDKHLYRPGEGFYLAAYILHPKSRGEITLKSTDPTAAPSIQPNYLSDKYDVDVLVKSINLLMKMANSSALSEFRGEQTVVADAPYAQNTQEYYEWFVREMTTTVYHPIGTTKMGKVDDPTTVVDSKLRVKGIQNLRVVDCSVMPTLTSGNTNVPAMAIGEKAAHIILQENS